MSSYLLTCFHNSLLALAQHKWPHTVYTRITRTFLSIWTMIKIVQRSIRLQQSTSPQLARHTRKSGVTKTRTGSNVHTIWQGVLKCMKPYSTHVYGCKKKFMFLLIAIKRKKQSLCLLGKHVDGQNETLQVKNTFALQIFHYWNKLPESVLNERGSVSRMKWISGSYNDIYFTANKYCSYCTRWFIN